MRLLIIPPRVVLHIPLVVESVIQVALVPVWLGLWLLVPPIILTLLAMGRGEKDMVFPRGHIQRKQTGDEDG